MLTRADEERQVSGGGVTGVERGRRRCCRRRLRKPLLILAARGVGAHLLLNRHRAGSDHTIRHLGYVMSFISLDHYNA